MFIKRIIAALAAALLLCCMLTACGKSSEDDRPEVTVWVLSDDYKEDIDRATASAFTSIDWKFRVEVVEASQLTALLEGDEEHLEALPDVFMLSPDMLPAFINSDVTADLGELGLFYDESRYYDYTINAGTDSEGRLKAACYEADPGLFFYRRSLAKYYLGTDEPSQIQSMISDWDGFYQTAQTLGELSGGDTCMVIGTEELMTSYLANVSFIKDGKLHIGEEAEAFIDYCYAMASEGLMYNAQRWSEAWIAGISDPQSIFGYFSSGLGMENVLKPCCGGTISGEGSYGDWAAVPAPQAYNWGGCWLAVRSDSPRTEEAALLIEYFTCEEAAMRTDCLISGAFSSNRTVAEQIKFDSQFTESFLSGQNCYNLMTQVADDITMDNQTIYDGVVKQLFAQSVADYAFGYSTREQAMATFEKTVFAAYPELAEV